MFVLSSSTIWRIARLILPALAIGAFGPATAFAQPIAAGPYRLKVTSDPETIPVGRANLIVDVTDSSGKPLSDLTVKAIARMPGMSMGEREAFGQAGDKAGRYVVPATFPMGGAYVATVTVEGPLGTGQGEARLVAGGAPGSGGNSNGIAIALGAALLLVIAFTIYRMRKSGQSFAVQSIANRQTVIGLVLVVAAIAVSMWIVRTQRRPGSMTPIEAQVMEMNMPAPVGAHPVSLFKVISRPIAGSLRYSGQAISYSEQDIVSRVPGTILTMPFYVGDSVKTDQLLVQLDSLQLEPKVSAGQAALGSASKGVAVAQLERNQAATNVRAAEADVRVARASRDQALADLATLKQDIARTEAEVEAAEAEISARTADVASKQADQVYWTGQYDRVSKLFEQGYVSRNEADRAKAELARAESALREANDQVRKAKSALQVAKIARTQVDSQILSAEKRISEADATIAARQSQVDAAHNAQQVAEARIDLSRSAVSESEANLRSATVDKGFTKLSAPLSGVITQRYLSPGQTVEPGQPILRIAQTSPIRLQANVAASDAASIRIGSRVTISSGQGKPIISEVTSVAPGVDPGSRTAVVEVVAPNLDKRFSPGQYVMLEIEPTTAMASIVVPASAVRSLSSSGQPVPAIRGKAFVWVAETSPGGQTVRKQDVEIGTSSGLYVSVSSGLKEGDMVVANPPLGMKEGDLVVPIDDQPAKTAQTVILNDSGYEPSLISIKANTPFTLTFIRKTELSCGEIVTIPSLGIERKLPINTPVTIEVPGQPAGELKFACGMDMFRGKVVLR